MAITNWKYRKITLNYTFMLLYLVIMSSISHAKFKNVGILLNVGFLFIVSCYRSCNDLRVNLDWFSRLSQTINFHFLFVNIYIIFIIVSHIFYNFCFFSCNFKYIIYQQIKKSEKLSSSSGFFSHYLCFVLFC